jgi:hypothetical protein
LLAKTPFIGNNGGLIAKFAVRHIKMAKNATEEMER